VAGSLAATGTWRADVLVRTVATPDYRTLPFTFTVGPGAAFIRPGLNPAAVSVTIAPGLLSAPNTVTIAGVQASAVRLLSQSLDMLMGSIPYNTTPLGGATSLLRQDIARDTGQSQYSDERDTSTDSQASSHRGDQPARLAETRLMQDGPAYGERDAHDRERGTAHETSDPAPVLDPGVHRRHAQHQQSGQRDGEQREGGPRIARTETDKGMCRFHRGRTGCGH